MVQLEVFLTLIKTHWFLSILIVLSGLIVTGSFLKGLSITTKILASLLILGIAGVVAFTIITFLS